MLIMFYWISLFFQSQCQLIQGDIIIIQERVTEAKATEQICPYPTVASFLEFVRNHSAVSFKPLENPKVFSSHTPVTSHVTHG